MAETRRRSAQSVRTGRGSTARKSYYVEGSAVRKIYRENREIGRPAPPRERERVQKEDRKRPVRTELSETARRNREKALGIGPAYVCFLVIICCMILFFAVRYLQLQTVNTARMKTAARLETELTQLREDNDAYYSQVTSNVDLAAIKKIAIGKLGMKYPDESQIQTYETEGRSYVRQFQDVPDVK